MKCRKCGIEFNGKKYAKTCDKCKWDRTQIPEGWSKLQTIIPTELLAKVKYLGWLRKKTLKSMIIQALEVLIHS